MSGKSVVDQIRHYQKDIERCPENSERMIRCIQRLYVLPIQVLHLQETGVGRSVNSLRKYKGEVGEAAKALVAKWKAMVAAEESSDDSNEKMKSNLSDSKLSKSSVPNVKVEPKYEKPVIKVEPKSEKPIVKTEPKSEKQEHGSSRDKHSSKDRSSSRDNSSSKEKSSKDKTHHSSSKHHGESHSSSRSHSSSVKRSHSSSEKNHNSEKKSSSHHNHKSSHNEKRHTSDEETPPSPKKHKKHHSHSRNHSHSKQEIVESEEEADEEEANESGDERSEPAADSSSDSEKDSSEDSENSSVEEELAGRLSALEEEEEEQDSDNSSSDHRHRSKHKSSSHKHSKSSHSHSEKNKENHSSHKSSSRDSSKKSSKDSNSSSKHLDELIKENEKKIKKEKGEFEVPKSIPSKTVKLERNEDGSIDSGSGASFADALLGMDNFVEPKKKKKSSSSSKESSSSSNHKTSSSQKNNSGHSSSSHKRSHSSSNSSTNSKEKSKESSSKPKSIDELVETPELLTKKVKLEALDLDISSTLPEINPNYKPLPHVPESSRRQSKMSEEDTMFSIMTTKNQRTKVYSGNKVYQNTVPTLFNLCIQLLYENIDAVEYTGGVPYNLLKPLLERLNSDQLYVIEHFNPYLIEDTDNLWKFHCSKDFRNQKRQDMESWRDLYLRCIEERERKLKAVTANISHSMAKSTPVRQAKLAYVDAVVKPPRNVARKQAKYGTGSSSSSKSTPNNNKQEIVSKAIVGGHTPGVSAKDVVPPPPVPRAVHHSTPAVLKKKKAPLMQKALQFIKGNRFKR